MKTNPLEQAFRRNHAIRKYADGALVTAETGQVPAITNVGTGMASLGDMMTDQPVDIATALEAIINPNQLAATQALSEIPLISQQAYAPQPIQTAQTAQPMSITSAGGLGGGGLGGITYDTLGSTIPTGGTTGTPTGGTTTGGGTTGTGTTTSPVNRTVGPYAVSNKQGLEYEPITFTGTPPTDLTKYIPVFDPRTGQRFESPAQALLYGVKDYVYSTPKGLGKPTSLSNYSDAEIADAAARSGISVEAYLNLYRNKDIADANQAKMNEYINTKSGGLSPQDLIAKLQYYKQNPPKTYQERLEQQSLYADYSNRYANSNYNYSNMGGVPQDYSLKPAETFFAPITGYAPELNNLLNTAQQSYNNMAIYKQSSDLIKNNPYINMAFQTARDILGNKAAETVLGGDVNMINSSVVKLAGDIQRMGAPDALKNFYNSLANQYGASTGLHSASLQNDPTYRELLKASQAFTPVASNNAWNATAQRVQTFGANDIFWRDPQSGKGWGYDPKNKSITVYDTEGRKVRPAIMNEADIIQLMDTFNMSPSSFGEFSNFLKSKGINLETDKVYGVNASGLGNLDAVKEVASDKWLQDQLAHYEWQRKVARDAGFTNEDPTQKIKELEAQNQAAKRLLAEHGTPPAAKNGGAVMMKRGGPVNLEKEFRLADMIDMKGVGSAKKFDEPVQKFAGAGLVKKAIQAGKKMSKAESEAAGLYHPIGGGLKLPKPVSEYKFETIQDPRFSPEVRRLLSPEDFLGKVGIPLLGDRAAAGKLLTEIEGRKLDEIIALEGGPEFMMNHPYLWASDKAVINKLAKQARKAAESGKDVLGVNVIGSPTNVDFNKMVSGVLFDNLDTSSLRKKDIKAFDAEMRKSFPEFLGLEHPDVKEQMFGPNMGTKRTEFVKIMNKDKYQSSGFPDVTAARIAVTEPRLIDMPTGSAGFTVGKFDPENLVIENPEIPHETYPVKTGGEYVGGLEAPLDFKDIFTDFSEARRMLGADPARDLRSLSFQSPAIQEFDQEWLDKVMPTYEEILKSKRYAKGGDVELEKEFKGKSRLIPKAVIDALNTKRKLSPAEAKIAGQYAKPENQWDVGSILEEIDPVYTVGRGAETLKNVDYGAIKDLLLQRYQLEKDPRKALEKELGQIGEAMFGALDVAPAGALATKPARTAIKSLAQKFEGAPVGLSIEDVTPKSVNFVSAVEKSIKGHKMEAMNGEQWANWMRANASKSAKKEAEATGLYDWLKSQGKVSKADIEAYVEGNLPQITRIEKGAPLKLTSKDEIRLAELHRRNTFKDQEPLSYDEYNELMRLENIRDKRTPEDLMRQSQMFEESAKKAQAKGDKEAAESLFKRSEHMAQRAEALELNPLEVGGSKFEKWKEPGGEKYRETLLVLPENRKINKAAYDFAEAKGISREEMDTNPDVREAVFAEMGKTTPVYEPSTAFRSKHWDEPNVLMHIRSNERLTPEGKRALFLEELQSDWAQKARKTGVKQDVTDDMLREYHESVRKDTDPTWEDLPSKDKAFLRHIVENRQIDAVPSAPYISDTGDWTKLGLKQALKDAIEGGHDYLAWTTGEQQAKRYDLSKQVSEIAYHPKGKALEVFDIEGNNIINEEGINPEDLADYIGKEAAEKVLNSTEIDRGYNILKGDNIRVGGEGMKAYYDRMVPQYMNDILKQYGIKDGVKPVDISYIQTKGIPKNLSADDLLSQYGRELAPDQRQYLERYLDRWDLESEMGGTEDLIGEYKNWLDLQDFSPKPIKTGTHLGIEITPELREKILNEGLPHFNEGGSVNNGLKRLVSRFESEYAVPFPRDN